MNKPLKNCPVCAHALTISRLSCPACQTQISGDFEMPGHPWALDQELADFIRVFIYAEGSIKQSEKLLNCSYPKIKNLLKKTKAAMGIKEQAETDESLIIDQLEKGVIDVEEALQQLSSKRR